MRQQQRECRGLIAADHYLTILCRALLLQIQKVFIADTPLTASKDFYGI